MATKDFESEYRTIQQGEGKLNLLRKLEHDKDFMDTFKKEFEQAPLKPDVKKYYRKFYTEKEITEGIEEANSKTPTATSKKTIAAKLVLRTDFETKISQLHRDFFELVSKKETPEDCFTNDITKTNIYTQLRKIEQHFEDFKKLGIETADSKEFAETYSKEILSDIEKINYQPIRKTIIEIIKNDNENFYLDMKDKNIDPENYRNTKRFLNFYLSTALIPQPIFEDRINKLKQLAEKARKALQKLDTDFEKGYQNIQKSFEAYFEKNGIIRPFDKMDFFNWLALRFPNENLSFIVREAEKPNNYKLFHEYKQRLFNNPDWNDNKELNLWETNTGVSQSIVKQKPEINTKLITFKNSETIEKIHLELKGYFPNKEAELLKALQGELLRELLLFPHNQNKFVEVFKRLKYNGFLLSTPKEIKNWICSTFNYQYQKGNKKEVRKFNTSTVHDILTKDKGEPTKKERICIVDWLPYKSYLTRQKETEKENI